MKKLIVTLLVLLTPALTHAAFSNGYTYCRTMTMTAGGNSGGVATTTTIGFPLVATSTISSLEATSSGGNIQVYNYASSTPVDTLVTDSTVCATPGTTLPFYWESGGYSSTTGAFVLWARSNDISSTSAKTITLYYGKAGDTDHTNRNGVFGTMNYKSVYDLSESPANAAPQGVDDTGNGFDMTNQGSMTSANQVAGYLGNAISFNGSAQYYERLNYSDGFTGMSTFTISEWVNTVSGSSGGSGLRNTVDQNGGFYNFLLSTGAVEVRYRANGTLVTWDSPNNTIPYGWAHLVQTYDGSVMNTYVNGVWVNTQTSSAGAFGVSGVPLWIGNASYNTQFTGYANYPIDDFRFQTQADNAMDILTVYNNTKSSAVFWTFGAEQTAGGTPSVTWSLHTYIHNAIDYLHKSIMYFHN